MLNAAKGISKIKASKGSNISFLVWFFLIAAWIMASYKIFEFSYGIQTRWHFVSHGWKQDWLFKNNLDFADYKVLDAIRGALRERKSTDPRDRAYALHGVLRATRATPSAADYSLSVGKTYQNLIEDLISYNSAAISIDMDAGSRGQFDGPSWVPNWQVSVSSAWLTSTHSLRVTDSCTPVRESSILISQALSSEFKGPVKALLLSRSG
jgi:hypothetical protein